MEPVSEKKFRDFFASMRANGPRAFAFEWMDYAHFEGLFKQCASSVKGEDGKEDGKEVSSPEHLEDARSQFFLELTSYLQKFTSLYEQHKQSILANKRGSAMHRAFVKAMQSMKMGETARRNEEARLRKSEISQQAFWLRIYAETTAVAVRELLQKYDFHTNSKAGTDFLRDFHITTGINSDALTEKSTFLMELRALEQNLERSHRSSSHLTAGCSDTDLAACNTHHHKGHSWVKNIRALSCSAAKVAPHDKYAVPAAANANLPMSVPKDVLPEWSMEDDDLQCSVCLDLLHAPVSLACGHCFCTDCVMSEARRVEATGGLLPGSTHVTKTSDAVRCPLCRRDGVTKGAISLNWLDRYIQSRFPAQWARQQHEVQERASAQRRSLAVQKLMAGAARLVVVDPIVIRRRASSPGAANLPLVVA